MAPEPTGSDEIRRFEAQYRQNPDSLIFARLADAHRKNGDPHRALSLLRDGIGRHPDYPSAHIVRARCLIDLDRPAEAEASLQRVLELDGQNLVAMRGLASLAQRRDDPVEAVRWFERIAVLDPMNAEAEAALERLRLELSGTLPGMEPLPAPREQWWSSPAPEVSSPAPPLEGVEGGSEEPDDADAMETPPGVDAGVAEELLYEEPVERGLPADGTAENAWWFEDPGEEEPPDDGDVLTRTMADLYVRQGLLNEAAAIYRELLADRPHDEGLLRALADLQKRLEPTEDEPVQDEPIEDEPVQDEPTEDEPTEQEPVAVELPEVEESPARAGGGEQSPAAREPAAEDTPESARRGPDAAGTVAGPPYSTHPLPEQSGTSEVFRAWLQRLTK